MGMFQKMVRFSGIHADIMQKFCKDKGGDQDVSFLVDNNSGEEENVYIFETRVHIYLVAGMLGIINNRKSDVDHSTNTTSSIMPEILSKQRQNLMRMYHHMVLDESNNLDADTKIKKAFSINKTEQEWDEEQRKLESYVRGGLEILNEIFGDCKSYEDICNAMFKLKEQLPEIYK